MQDPKKLRVWHLAHDLSNKVIRALPISRARIVPNLRSQAIRAATAIPWNIAEGCKCETRPQFVTYVQNALTSASELEAELLTARDNEVISESQHAQLMHHLDLVRKLLYGLMRTLKRRIAEDEEGKMKEREEARRKRRARKPKRKRG